jgi:hypothetical protein
MVGSRTSGPRRRVKSRGGCAVLPPATPSAPDPNPINPSLRLRPRPISRGRIAAGSRVTIAHKRPSLRALRLSLAFGLGVVATTP